jgi:hypothetical protein
VVEDARRNRLLLFEDSAVWAFDLGRRAERRWPRSVAGEVSIERRSLALEGAFPNPSSGDLSIRFTLPDAEPAALDLFDVVGRRLWTEDVGRFGPGRHVVRLAPAAQAPPGLYFVRLTRGRETLSSKVLRIAP